MRAIRQDLAEEYEALDAIVRDLDETAWLRVTPFFSWTVKDQVSHLAYFDRAASQSVTDPDQFKLELEKLLQGGADYDRIHRSINALGGAMASGELLSWWREQRQRLLEAYTTVSPKDKLPWFGPPMSARSSATGRIMETWAHGQDILDALGLKRSGTPRLKHVAHLGVATFAWSFQNLGLKVPEQQVRVELTGPNGEQWVWGPEGGTDVIRGPAEDFCLVVTKRRHSVDTRLEAEGETASKWLAIAQAFAGPAQEGTRPGGRR